jgi:hypothetical protein
VVKNTVKGIININYRAIIEVFIEVYSEVIIRKSTIYIRSQITSQLNTPLINKRRHIISSIKIQKMLEIIKLLWPTSKTF